jgi:hypothetical protein
MAEDYKRVILGSADYRIILDNESRNLCQESTSRIGLQEKGVMQPLKRLINQLTLNIFFLRCRRWMGK